MPDDASIGARPRQLWLHLLLAALLFPLPHIVGFLHNHGSYTPFSFAKNISSLAYDESFAYAPQARRFMTSGELQPEADVYELRHQRGVMPFAAEIVLGLIGRLTGSLEAAFVSADVVFPPLALWLFFCLSEGLVEGVISRWLLAWMTVLVGFAPRNFLGLGLDGWRSTFEIARTPNPEITLLFLLAATLLLSRALDLHAPRGVILATVLLSALNIYGYYFYTVSWALTLTLLFLFFCLWREWRFAMRLALIGIGTTLLGIPFLLAFAHGQADGNQANFIAHLAAPDHNPRWLPLLAALCGLTAIAVAGRRYLNGTEPQRRMTLLGLVLITGLLGMNQQILSGLDVSNNHFLYRVIEPLAFFGTCCLLYRFRPQSERVAAIALCLLLTFAGARHAAAGWLVADSQRLDSPEMELLLWMRAHVAPDRVIGTDDANLMLLIPVITTDYNYIPMQLRSYAPEEMILQRHREWASLTDQAGTLRTALSGRLDYCVLANGHPDPPALRERFPDAHVIHRNSGFRLIALER